MPTYIYASISVNLSARFNKTTLTLKLTVKTIFESGLKLSKRIVKA